MDGQIIDHGVIFLFARWSDSTVCLARVRDVLAGFPKLRLQVIDLETPDYRSFVERFGIISQGKGEIFWIYKASIFKMLPNCMLADGKMLEYCQLLNDLGGENDSAVH